MSKSMSPSSLGFANSFLPETLTCRDRYNRRGLSLTFLLTALGFVVLLSLKPSTRGRDQQHHALEELLADPVSSSVHVQAKLSEKTLQAWSLHPAALDDTMLAKTRPAPPCGCDGCSSGPSITGARRLSLVSSKRCSSGMPAGSAWPRVTSGTAMRSYSRQPSVRTFASQQSQSRVQAVAAVAAPPPLQEASIVDVKSDSQGAVVSKNVFHEMSAIARQLGDDGVDLGQGFPDFDPPEFVVDALREGIAESMEGEVSVKHQYTRTAGFPPLVEALAERYSHHLAHTVDPMSEVAVTVGATNALYLSLQTLLDQAAPGCDEVVVLEPFFELYRAQTQGLKGTLRTVPLGYDMATRSFSLDIEALTRAIGPKTVALIVNTPNNPTGKVFEEDELLAIADLVRAHPHVTVISDEVYKFMIFDPPSNQREDDTDSYYFKPVGHVHFAKLPGMWSRTITVSSAGKTFGITGWQVGWAIGPEKWIVQMQRYMSNLQFCAPTLMQRALTKVLKRADEPYRGYQNYYVWLRLDYWMRRERMISALEDAGVSIVKPQGGFFLLADIKNMCGKNGPLGDVWDEVAEPDEAPDWTFARALAKKLGVVVLPISPFFGSDTPDDVRTRFVRFCFAKTSSTLDEAVNRLQMLKTGIQVSN
eukprot:gnl/TRDRNA2_/TRDRNA2_194908_c0_seq1.p1 gnl/TRDRNA2_/TRDRNA2_194908_c0~~gnl/TRDRNA2_/TRDRNA2_194908_c0_seq1.p1  ORF type:complete len:646 (+),score=79.69 gnl/TRDRNA2_/TRDRNA2_194908_c0_seq1:130-2067(+)